MRAHFGQSIILCVEKNLGRMGVCNALPPDVRHTSAPVHLPPSTTRAVSYDVTWAHMKGKINCPAVFLSSLLSPSLRHTESFTACHSPSPVSTPECLHAWHSQHFGAKMESWSRWVNTSVGPQWCSVWPRAAGWSVHRRFKQKLPAQHHSIMTSYFLITNTVETCFQRHGFIFKNHFVLQHPGECSLAVVNVSRLRRLWSRN